MVVSTVLFDLDGTLLDSGGMILASLRHVTRTVLRREIPDAELLAPVGGSGLRDQMLALDGERAEELVSAYREHNEPLHAGVVAFPGVASMLARLQDDGRRVGLVTAKRRTTVALAEPALPALAEFDVVVTWEDTERHKPQPDPILLALARLGAEARSACYVGDSPFDVAAARDAGVLAVAATWGGIHTRQRLEGERPDAVVSSPEELLTVLRRLDREGR
ncbi:MAG: HAD hydrolase-like protein [Actinomycetota bacterium]|nr:HAD hydrolase-like protein [Actinomycetota bacterium]